MIGQGFLDGWRRAAGFLALLAAAALVALAQPPHAEARTLDTPAASVQQQDGEHHQVSADAHCASHCASHNAAAPVPETTPAAVAYGGHHRYRLIRESAPRAVTLAPPIRPPAN